MKLLLLSVITSFFVPLSLFGQEIQFRNNLTQEQIEYINHLNIPWGEGFKTSKEAFAQIKKIILEDPYSRSIYFDVEKKLKSMGIPKAEDVIHFCEEMKGNASGGFYEDIKVSGMEVVIPGKEIKWSDSALEAQRKSFRWKILKLPFFEVLLIAGRPEICVSAEQSIREAQNIFVHEFHHFLKSDSFEIKKNILSMTDYQEYSDYQLFSPGGEVEAYRTGVKAELRFYKKIGIINTNFNYPFVDTDGNIKNETDLRNYVRDLYSPYYDLVRPTIVAFTNQFNSSRIWLLEAEIYFNPGLDQTLKQAMLEEIARLKSLSIK